MEPRRDVFRDEVPNKELTGCSVGDVTSSSRKDISLSSKILIVGEVGESGDGGFCKKS